MVTRKSFNHRSKRYIQYQRLKITVRNITQKIPVFYFFINCDISSTDGDVKNCAAFWKSKAIIAQQR